MGNQRLLHLWDCGFCSLYYSGAPLQTLSLWTLMKWSVWIFYSYWGMISAGTNNALRDNCIFFKGAFPAAFLSFLGMIHRNCWDIALIFAPKEQFFSGGRNRTLSLNESHHIDRNCFLVAFLRIPARRKKIQRQEMIKCWKGVKKGERGRDSCRKNKNKRVKNYKNHCWRHWGIWWGNISETMSQQGELSSLP